MEGGVTYFVPTLSRPPSKRRRKNTLLIEKICQIYSRNREIYGSPRVHAELRVVSVRCGRRRVSGLMRAAGLQSVHGKKRTTTCRDPRAAPALDLLGRGFVATRPNRIWLADIIYVPTQEGFLYRSVLVWESMDHPTLLREWASKMKAIVVDALQLAVWRREPSVRLVHHYDHGAQYTAISFGKHLEEVGIIPSMGRSGTALGNAMAEGFGATLKTELLVHRRRFPDREVAKSVIFEYPERFHNWRRLHPAWSYRSPADYEETTTEGVAVA